MANADGGNTNVDSWPGFLSELTKSFLILRDIFGYALPGSVFLAIGILSGRLKLEQLQTLLQPYQDKIPWWLALIVGIAACYTVGHLMAQIAYFLKNGWGLPWGRKTYTIGFVMAWIACFLKYGWGRLRGSKNGLAKPEAPQTDGPDLFNLREDHPVLLTEYDRQTVMTQLRGSTGAAMLMGYLLFDRFPTPSIGVLAEYSGVFLLAVFLFSALPHMEELAQRTSKVGKTAMEADQKQPADGLAQLKQLLEALLAAAQEALKKL